MGDLIELKVNTVGTTEDLLRTLTNLILTVHSFTALSGAGIKGYETQDFSIHLQEPNKETQEAIYDAEKGDLNMYESVDAMFEKLGLFAQTGNKAAGSIKSFVGPVTH